MRAPESRPLASLNWVDYGGEGETMLAVHGLGGSVANFDAVGPRLAKDRRVVAVDLPGFGLSPPQGDYRLQTHAAAVARFIEEIDAPVNLMGNSMGGLVCEMIASTRPDLVENLILVAPATPLRWPDPHFHSLTALRLSVEAIPFVGEKLMKRLATRMSPEEMVDLSLRMITHDPSRIPPQVVESMVAMAHERRGQLWAATALNRSASSIGWLYRRPRDFVRMFRKISVPTLLIQGSSDRIVSPTNIRWLASLRSDWTYVEMDDTGHTPQLDAPIRFCLVVEEWFGELAPGSGPECGD